MCLREGVCNKTCGLLQVEKKILKADPLAFYISNSFFFFFYKYRCLLITCNLNRIEYKGGRMSIFFNRRFCSSSPLVLLYERDFYQGIKI